MIARKLSRCSILLIILIISAGVLSCSKTEKGDRTSTSQAGSENNEMDRLRKIGSENYLGSYFLTWTNPHETSDAIQTAKTKLSQLCPDMKSTKAKEACKIYQEVMDSYEERIPGVIELYDQYQQSTKEWLQLQHDWNAAEARVDLEAGKLSIDELRQAREEASSLREKHLEIGKEASEYKNQFQKMICTIPGMDQNSPDCPGYDYRTKVAELLK
jgi:hypothetical protein